MLKLTYPMFMLIVFSIFLIYFKQHPPKKSGQNSNNKASSQTDEAKEKENDKLLKLIEIDQARRQRAIINQRLMMEYPDVCYVLQVWTIKPDKAETDASCDVNYNYNNDKINNGHVCETNVNWNKKGDACISDGHETQLSSDRKDDSSLQNQQRSVNKIGLSKTHIKPVDNVYRSNAIVYVFVAFLVFSLVRALMDILKQLKKNAEEDKNDFSRRCSLHEFAQSRHNRKNSRKKTVSRQSSATIPSTPPPTPFINSTSIFARLFESTKLQTTSSSPKLPSPPVSKSPPIVKHVPTLNETAITPRSPAKPGKLLAGRPAPLLRRSSFPILVGGQQCATNHIGRARRPSMDSLSEGDSSPDTKRRIHMIHRH